jgi:DNA polymerase III gamma/tau subunit
MEEGFEKPFVEKYRPETLNEVVGKNISNFDLIAAIGNKFAID